MFDYTVGSCPVCGGRLYVDTQYPDDIKCDTCEYDDLPANEKKVKISPCASPRNMV